MSFDAPVGASGRVEPSTVQVEPGSRSGTNKGGDFSTPLRSDSPMPARVGELLLSRLRGELAERDLGIVGFVGEFRLASSRQLRQLFFPAAEFATPETAARCGRRVLNRLTSGRLLTRLERRVGGVRAGSDGFVYALGPVGFRMTQPEGRSRPRNFEPTVRFVDHQLAVSNLAVALRLARLRGEVSRLELQGEPRSWRMLPGQRAHAGLLRPDLHVRLYSGGVELSWFIEVDCGTTHLPALLRKCALYESYYRSGVEQAEHGVFPRVLWVTRTEARAARIGSAIAHRRGLTSELFAVTNTPTAVPVLRGAEIER